MPLTRFPWVAPGSPINVFLRDLAHQPVNGHTCKVCKWLPDSHVGVAMSQFSLTLRQGVIATHPDVAAIRLTLLARKESD